MPGARPGGPGVTDHSKPGVPPKREKARRAGTRETERVSEGAYAPRPFSRSPVMKVFRKSIGMGKMMVEFFSVPISVNVWR